MKRLSPAIVGLLVGLCLVTVTAANATTVGTGNGTCTEALLSAAITAGGSVNFNCGPSPFTFTLTGALPTVSTDTSVDGGNLITIDGASSYRIFDVAATVTLTLNNITLAHGATSCCTSNDVGGAVRAFSGNLTADNVTFDANTSAAGGGAVYAFPCTPAGSGCPAPTVTITNSRLTNNSSTNPAGALFAGGANLTISDDTFTGNSSLYGGAIAIYGSTDASITRSTFSGNFTAGASNSSQGGGGAISVENAAVLTISNSTFSGNSAPAQAGNATPRGGAMFLWGPPSSAVLNNLTIANNSAPGGGAGIFFNASTTTLMNSIVSNNTGGNCLATSTFVDGGNNLQYGDSTCTGATVGNPLLLALADNGGLTQTMALSAGSPAIDAGNDATATATDQRGQGRVDGNLDSTITSDIGAFEFVPQAPAQDVPTIDPSLLALLAAALLLTGVIAARRV